MTPKRPSALLVLAVSVTAAASCGGGSSGGGTSSPKPVIQKATTASGDLQTGTVAAPLANPLRVLVTLGGSPLQADTVTWATSGTGASVSPAQSVTDASGIAAATWTLSQTAGSQSATAASTGTTGSPLTFMATATAAAAAQIALASGDNQAGALNTTLANPPVVHATDAFGNAVAGATVAWAVTSGPATVNPATSTTDAGGAAQTSVQLGATTGPVVITATSAGLAGSPVTFHEASATPATAAVQIGDNFFKSGQNGTQNPAVDTVTVGTTVTWTWAGAASHSVASTGTPSFTSSTVKTTGTYSFTFTTAGTYAYDCSVHGAVMSGSILVK